MPIRALEFYSGIGGFHRALSRCPIDASVVQAFDWEPLACQTYAANHSHTTIKKVDVSTLTATSLAFHDADLWLLSPPCQPYTVLNPNAKGDSDNRAQSFLYLVQDVLPELATTDSHPRYLLVENVAGFEASNSRQILLSTLRSLGYSTLELLLTPLQYGIPNSRLRYYLLAKLAPLSFSHIPPQANHVWHHIPGQDPWLDPRIEHPSSNHLDTSSNDTCEISEYLDEELAAAPHPNAVPDRILEKRGQLFDIVLPTSHRTCCFTRGYTQLVESSGSILQTNSSLDTTATFNAFSQAKAAGDKQSVEILRPLGLRYFTPSELLRLFGFTPPGTSTSFLWPERISTKSKYRLIGNSVNVKVVEQLITYLFQEGT